MAGLGYYAEDYPDIQRTPLPVNPDNFSYIIPVEDELEHTQEHPFCYDQTCDCHEDQDEIGLVAQYVQGGLMTPDEATDFVGGKHI
jgi:hypothetical protein